MGNLLSLSATIYQPQEMERCSQMLKQKWINDKKAKLNGEIKALQNHAQQLQQQFAQIGQAILRKQGELHAIEEVEVELIQKEKEPKKKEK